MATLSEIIKKSKVQKENTFGIHCISFHKFHFVSSFGICYNEKEGEQLNFRLNKIFLINVPQKAIAYLLFFNDKIDYKLKHSTNFI